MVKVRDAGAPTADTEKITVNLGFVDLGRIDLLVREGFYSNRSDFIRTAIRQQLDRHADTIHNSVQRDRFDLGLRRYGAVELEAVRAAGERLNLHVVGLLVLAPDVSPELARATIGSIRVLGAFHAAPEVKQALSGRMT
ncbi:MAG TPA: CopG family transcriptional regulator [Beijerinckiaceae bacterium]|jgi:Arc/MetJ-type ribon-helix-helix transcriptional regulator